MKHLKKLNESEANSSREIEHKMVTVSNSSPVTMSMASKLAEVLSKEDFRAFSRWLDLAKREQETKIQAATRGKGRGFY